MNTTLFLFSFFILLNVKSNTLDTCYYITASGDTISCLNYQPENGGKMQIIRNDRIFEESFDYKKGKLKLIRYNDNGTKAMVVQGYVFNFNPDSIILDGAYELYNRMGKLMERLNYKDNLLDGKQTFYYLSGFKNTEMSFCNGKKHGDYIEYFDSTENISFKGTYKQDARIGLWNYYFNNNSNSIKATGKFEKKSLVYNSPEEKGFDSLYKVTSQLEKIKTLSFPTYFYLRSGIWRFYNEKGEIIRKEEYVGTFVKVHK